MDDYILSKWLLRIIILQLYIKNILWLVLMMKYSLKGILYESMSSLGTWFNLPILFIIYLLHHYYIITIIPHRSHRSGAGSDTKPPLHLASVLHSAQSELHESSLHQDIFDIMPRSFCLHCKKHVPKKSQFITCRTCDLWTHRNCLIGN